MEFQNILFVINNQIAYLTINRPEKLNALNSLTIKEIGEAVNAGIASESVRLMVITGAGEKSFVAGADISEFEGLQEQQARQLALTGQNVFSAIENSPKPIIAAVNGFALGGGCELAMACHLRVASENAKFGLPEVKLGLIPAYGGTQRLTRLIGKSKALEMMMTTDMMGAQEAYQRGLVNYVVPSSELINKCNEIASRILQQAPLSIAGVIQCANKALTQQDGYSAEVEIFGTCFNTEDNKEGVAAFKEKRAPVFKGK